MHLAGHFLLAAALLCAAARFCTAVVFDRAPHLFVSNKCAGKPANGLGESSICDRISTLDVLVLVMLLLRKATSSDATSKPIKVKPQTIVCSSKGRHKLF